jgi:transcriptional regulator with XRE-family HTH domain
MNTPPTGTQIPHPYAVVTANAVRAELARARTHGTAAGAVLGLSQSSMSRRLSGEVEFTASELLRLAKWLDVPAARLLGDPPP